MFDVTLDRESGDLDDFVLGLLTLFKSYQDDEVVIMKGSGQ